MRLAVADGPDAHAKTRAVVAAFPGAWRDAVVDVGARGRELADALPGHCSYTGVDISPGAEVHADLGDHLPFDDHSIDTVVALDVLEHVDDIHHGFSELCRVADAHLVVGLPNVYELPNRWNVATGRSMSKYGLPGDAPEDRHRWFFSLQMAADWIRYRGRLEGWKLCEERALVGPRRARYAGWFVQWRPNLLAETYLAHLARVEIPDATVPDDSRTPASR